ncbi:MAG: GspE/PulE family protein [Rhodocyclales bacterium]|nr:GspE/PulE family protein [Rhodocyclales bacterium]
MSTAPRPLGQTLLAQGLISVDQLEIALREQTQRHEALGRVLVHLGFLSESTLRDALAHTLERPSMDLRGLIPDPEALRLVPRALAQRLKVVPVHYAPDDKHLVLACGNPDDLMLLDQLRLQLPAGTQLELRIAGDSEISRALEQIYGHVLSIDGILHEIESGTTHGATPGRSDEYAHPVVRLVDALLADAVSRDASDIHFEPEVGFIRIRYRMDGLLHQIRALHKTYWPAMAVRLKVMAGLNIAETRAPQDGRITLQIHGRPVDFRVSCQPTVQGENIVLRILDRQKGIVPLDGLGLTPERLEVLRQMIHRPEGMILVTGPTGSGKTTTLYSVLGHLNTTEVNIMTLEDPVEYPMPLIRQSAVSEASRLGFADGVRAMLRQDPDIILVGEVRDAETARMSLQAAMTGHLVFSTLHTNSTLGAIPRLLDIGIAPDLLAGNIIGVIAQRLLRRLCPACSRPRPAQPAERALLGLPPDTSDVVMLHEPVGCPQCHFQGYRGRLAIMEILELDESLDALIGRRASLVELRQHALARGFEPLARDGVRRVLDGSTSLPELRRVVHLEGQARP